MTVSRRDRQPNPHETSRMTPNPSSFSSRSTWHAACGLAIFAALSACTVGPDYQRPDIETPAAFKENQGWTVAAPADDAPRGKWWQIYGDSDLDALEDAAIGNNQTVVQAEASYRAALTLVDAARANYFPIVAGDASITRNGGGSRTSSGSSTTRQVSLSASWEIDLWGRVRRQVESQRASADASASDLAGIALSVQSSIASNYFQLRQIDTQKQLLDDTITAFERSLQVTRNRYAGGVSARVDVAQAETQLKNTQVQAIDLGTARAQLEHAIALLTGKPASSFSIPVKRWQAFDDKRAPAVPLAGLPSQLLQRRPDIASAERRVAAANAQIGVAKAAYFPTLGLSAQGGFSSLSASDLFSAPNRFWSIGPSLAQTLFDAGARRAATAQAVANYDATVAGYRETVLSGFADVEDQLATLRILEQESAAQDDALASAREALALTINQYKAGTVSYIDVVTTQATALSSERNAVSIFGSRMIASVSLVRALGGPWSPTPAGN
jgi:NodT family efflux transporter outer membrane factor (OMF) lipoprotein